MIQHQQWHTKHQILITDMMHDGSVQVSIPTKNDKADNTKDKADAIIYALWVGECYRQRGAGRELLAKAEREAKRMGCKKVCLWYDNHNAPSWLKDWYIRLGYKEAINTPHEVVLVKDL